MPLDDGCDFPTTQKAIVSFSGARKHVSPCKATAPPAKAAAAAAGWMWEISEIRVPVQQARPFWNILDGSTTSTVDIQPLCSVKRRKSIVPVCISEP